MKKLMTAAVLLAGLSGCPGSVNGTVGGVQLPVSDAIFAVLKDNGKTVGAAVYLSDKPKLCDSLHANRETKQATSMLFLLSRTTTSDVLAPDVGDYTVIEFGRAEAGNRTYSFFSRTDANCTNTISSTASGGKSGLVKLTNFKPETGGSANGTFDVTFGAGDKVTGNFNATFCDITEVPANPNCE